MSNKSKVAIVNRALALLGANRIINLTDDTQEAKIVNNMYDGSLKSILCECCWNFATKRKMLNMLTTKPEWGGGNMFQLPSDMVRIFETSADVDYTIEGNYLITRASEIGIKYTYVNDDDSVYPPYFVDAFVYRLAHDICYDLTNSASRANELLDMYEGHYLPVAKSKNARDKTPVKVKDGDWVNSVNHARWD